MSREINIYNKKGSIISIALTILFVAVVAQAATTIGLNISTDGTITASSTANQLVLGIAPATVTISSTAPASARTYTIPDNATTNANFVLAPTSVTATQALFASATAGSPVFRAIALTDLPAQTGTGNIAMSTSPTFVTPTLGVATATSINKVAFTAPTTAATFAFGADNTTQTFQGTDTIVGRATTDTLTNKTLTSPVISTITNTGTITLPTTTTTLAGLAVAQTFSADQTIGAGTKLVFDTGTVTSTSSASTLNKQAGIVTSEALTTATSSTWSLVLTNTLISSASNIIAQATLGTATTGTPLVTKITPGAGSATIVVTNISATAALNGTILLSFTLLN